MITTKTKQKPERILAWHFVGNTLRDGSPVPADGVWLEVPPPIKLCERGLHASRHPFDALRYAPGNTLCLVELAGEIVEGDDKLAASRRRIVARMDATEMLRYFARMQALSCSDSYPGEPADEVIEWLMTGDEAVRSAAASAAWSAAASSAAWSAASSAAWSAASSAAWSAASSAAWSAAPEEFRLLVEECFEGPQGNYLPVKK